MSDDQATFQAAVQAHQAGDFAGAERLYRQCPPHWPRPLHNLGHLLKTLGRLEEADVFYRRALAINPNSSSRHGLALTLLGQGRYAEGWPLHEARRTDPGYSMVQPEHPFPEWRGEPLKGRRLLVYGEQCFGDQIMFSRFAAAVRDMGAEVTLIVSAALARLFEPLGFPVVGGSAEIPEADYWCLMGSLPLWLGVTLDTIPPPTPLAIPGGGRGVGVVTRGRPTHFNDHNRSLSAAAAARLLALGQDLSPEATGVSDFRGTAEIVADLDLVITVDTANAHLAGSMGKPTWLLLPSMGVDWRWLRGRSDSPWYPSMRIFRQAPGNDWLQSLTEVEAELDRR